MKLLSLSKTAVVLGGAVSLCSLSPDVEAATARVRCRVVDGPRVRVQVDGQDLLRGTYKALVVNQTTLARAVTALGKQQTATALNPDVDLDFDSTAQADDKDTFIPATFARRGHTVKGYVRNASTGRTVASATTVCAR